MSGNFGSVVDFSNLIFFFFSFLGPGNIVNSKHCCTRICLSNFGL